MLVLNVKDVSAIEIDTQKLIDDVIDQEITGAFALIARPAAEQIANAVLNALYTEINLKIQAATIAAKPGVKVS